MFLTSVHTFAERRGIVVATVLCIAASLLLPGSAFAQGDEPVYTARFSSLAAKGHDVVAYFTVGSPTEGSKDHEVEYRGATWRFASADNKALFEADPERYAPRYGGYCAWAMAQGKKAPGDPRYWKITGDRLYLNYSANVQKDWEVDIPGFIASADDEWAQLTSP